MSRYCESFEEEMSAKSELTSDEEQSEPYMQYHKKNKSKCSHNRHDICNTTKENDQYDDLEDTSDSSCYDTNRESKESNNGVHGFEQLFRKNLPKLKLLWKANKGRKIAMLNRAGKELIQCLCQCSNVILQGHVKLTGAQLNRLAKHKHTLRKMVRPENNWMKKKAIITHSNEFLLPLLTTIFSSLD
jgi:hypothetical protein